MKACLRTKILYRSFINVWRETKNIELYPGDSIIFTIKFDVLGTKTVFDRLRYAVKNSWGRMPKDVK